MTETKIEGNTIRPTRTLTVSRMAAVNPADDLMIDANNDGWITHAAPGAGYAWVISSVTVGFALQPVGPFRLEILYNVGAGNVVVFNSYVGGPECGNGTNVSGINTFGFYWPVSRLFPENASVTVTLYSGDGVTASSLNLLSWVEDLA